MYLIVINSVILRPILSNGKFKKIIFLQPKSESSDKTETGSARQTRPKKVVGIKNLLRKKLPGSKKSKSVSSDLEEDFHGFTDSEIETASLKSNRSIVSDVKQSKKSKQKKFQPIPRNNKKSVDQPDDVSVDLEEIKEKDLIVSGKRKWKPSLKVQENSKKKEKTKTARKSSGGSETVDLQTSVKVSAA